MDFLCMGRRKDRAGRSGDRLLCLCGFGFCIDFYTPVIIANNTFLAEEPETARAFLDAVSRGYEFAIEHPQEAGDILCRAAPELDPELVKASQEYLADKYQADAPKWGYIDQKRWDAYYAWLNEKGLTETPIEAGTGFSNEYLP